MRYATVGDKLAAHFLAGRRLPSLVLSRPDDRSWATEVAPGDVVVLDGYHLGPADVAAARARGARVAALDDLGRRDIDADVVVNPNDPHAFDGVQPDGELLLGPRYALVRAGFRRRRRHRSPPGVALVTMGGSDPRRLGPTLAAVLAASDRVERVVLVEGPGAAGEAVVPGVARVRDPSDVPATFDAAEVAVCGAGSSVWELLAMGIPVALVVVADNQESIAREAVGAGAAIDLGRPDRAASALGAAVERLADDASAMSHAALALVDGRGPERVLDALVG